MTIVTGHPKILRFDFNTSVVWGLEQGKHAFFPHLVGGGFCIVKLRFATGVKKQKLEGWKDRGIHSAVGRLAE